MNRVLLLLTVLALVVTTACAAPNPLAGTGGTSAPAPRAQAPAAPATGGGGSPGGPVVALPPGYGTKVDTAARIDRLAQVDARFRTGGEIGGLRAAGFTGNAVFQSRQPLEETFGNTGYYSGSVASVTGPVNWPMCVTTNDYSRLTGRADTRPHLANANTGSALFTNVDVHGEVTIYVDCTNWGQMLPGSPGAVAPQGFSTPAVSAPSTGGQGGAAGVSAPANNCLTIGQLKALGTVLLYQDTDGKTVAENSGNVAGVQIRPSQAWAKPDGWTFHYQGNTAATSIPAGQAGTAWSPDSCRPLQS